MPHLRLLQPRLPRPRRDHVLKTLKFYGFSYRFFENYMLYYHTGYRGHLTILLG